jgi:hypothetical protein
LSRELVNRLKWERGVDSYVPLTKNMTAYDDAVRLSGYGMAYASEQEAEGSEDSLCPRDRGYGGERGA